MANFDLSAYSSVDDRIHLFWEKYPNGRLETEIVHLQKNEMGQLVQIIIKASAWRDITDPHPSSVDFAEETLGSNPVNRTSFVENCATSSLGRCLATLGFSPKGENKRPSQIEMTKAERVTGNKLPNLSDVVNEALIASGQDPIPAEKPKAPNYSSPHPNPTDAQRATLEKRAAELKIPPARLDDYLNMILGRDLGTRISKRDASELIGMDRETWADIAKVMGF